MIRYAIGAVFFSLLVPCHALADEPRERERFQIVEQRDGVILRIDRETGIVSRCAMGNGVFACRLVPDDRAALDAEIARLMAENERLRLGLAQDGPEADGPMAQAPATPQAPTGPRHDEEALKRDLDRAMDVAREAMRRFFGMVEDLRRDLEAPREI